MLIKLSQLRKIIREELSRTLSEDASDLSAAEPSEMVKNLAGKTGLGPFSYGPISLRNLMAKVESTGDISLLDNWDKVVAAAYETEKEIKRIRSTPTYEITDAQGNKQVRPRSPGSILNTESRKAAEDAAAEQGLEGEVAGRDYAAYVSTLVDSMKNFKQVPPTRDDIIAALELRKQKRDANELKKKQNQEALIAAKEEIPGYAKYIDFLYGEIMSAQHSEFQSYEQDVPKANIEKINSMIKAAWDPSAKSFDPAGMSDIDKMIPARFKK